MLNLQPPRNLLHKMIQPRQIDSEQQFLNWRNQQYFYQIIDNAGSIRDPLKINHRSTYEVVEITDDGIVNLKDQKLINYQPAFAKLKQVLTNTCGDYWDINEFSPFGKITVNNVAPSETGQQIGFIDWQTKIITFKGSQSERSRHLKILQDQIEEGTLTNLVDTQPYLFDHYITKNVQMALNDLGYQLQYQRLRFDSHHNVKTVKRFNQLKPEA